MADESNVDKQALYGNFQKHQDAKNKLALTAAHKALDIPEDDMQINSNKTVNVGGVSAKTLLGVAAISSLLPTIPLIALLALGGLSRQSESPRPQPQQQIEQHPQEWQIQIFRQKDGKWEAKERTP